MNTVPDAVRCLWIPLRGVNMLLPNVAVAEVASYQVPGEQQSTPDWLLGAVNWRGEALPVISLEILCGHRVPANMACSRLIVVNSVRPGSPVRFFAIVAAGLPRLIQFSDAIVNRLEVCELETLHCRVVVGREKAVIPNLDHIQGLLETHRAQAA
jgi:chemosensory pili system protein ChpC